MRSLYFIFYTCVSVLLCPGVLAFPSSEELTSSFYRAPLYQPGGNDSVDDTYIVKFFANHTLEQHYDTIGLNLSESHNLLQRFNHLPGYHARLQQDLLERVRRDPGVHFVEQDHVKTTSAHDLHVSRDVDGYDDAQDDNLSRKARRWIMNTIVGALWSRAMMSEGSRFLGNRGAKRTARFIQNVGKGVYIYIFDTGIRLTHQEFEGRASNLGGATTSQYCNGESMEDTDGHGTGVASAAAGKTYGMAMSANLVSVKVSCTNKKYRTASNLIAAVEAVIEEHKSRKGTDGFKGSVINMSFVDPRQTESEKEVFATARILGILLTAAAGNNKKNEILYPCAYPGVICVAACTRDYTIWDDPDDTEGSNYGSHVALFAPGKNVMVATFKSDKGGYTRSGTSIASPEVAGILGGFISYEGLSSDANVIEDRLMKNALNDALDNIPDGTPNILANNGILRTDQVGVPDQLPYIGAPPIEKLEQPAEDLAVKSVANPSNTQNGGLSSIITVTAQPTDADGSSAAPVLAIPTMFDDCAPQVAVYQWKDFTSTTTIQPQITSR